MNIDNLWIVCQSSQYVAQAEKLSAHLQLPLRVNIDIAAIGIPAFVILVNEYGISLQQTGPRAPGPIRAEFVEGSVDHRRKFGGGKGQMIAKAVGVKAGVYPKILDATAGLGKDAFVLATLGCRLYMLERSPIVHALLADGLGRASASYHDPELTQIIARMTLMSIDSQEYLSNLMDEDRPDVIYLDPMFPDRQKSADVKKEIAAFHQLVGKDEDADLLLEKALAKANYRVVVKRPRKAPPLGQNVANKMPFYQLEGKSSRYDIYTIKKMPEHLGCI